MPILLLGTCSARNPCYNFHTENIDYFVTHFTFEKKTTMQNFLVITDINIILESIFCYEIWEDRTFLMISPQWASEEEGVGKLEHD